MKKFDCSVHFGGKNIMSYYNVHHGLEFGEGNMELDGYISK